MQDKKVIFYKLYKINNLLFLNRYYTLSYGISILFMLFNKKSISTKISENLSFYVRYKIINLKK